MSYTCIRIEGGLLSPDFLERIHEMPGQKPADFGLDRHRALVDEVSAIWSDARSYWDAFQRRLARAASAGESITTITREQWVIPLLEVLGYRLSFQRRATEADGRSYAISHRAGEDESSPPVHIVGCDQELGSRPSSGRGQLSAHALVQDYLNRTDHLWGIVTNGFVLRLLRDSSYFTRPTYLEFDLKSMLEGDRLDEFILFYRLAHRSRLPKSLADAPQCWLERYYQHAIEQGDRIRDGLRDAVEQAILTLANGFLRHPKNEALRERIRQGSLSAYSFYQQLLYFIYRLLFLMVAEERNLLLLGSSETASEYYRTYYSVTRLRTLVDEPLTAPERFDDLFLSLQTLFHVLRNEDLSRQLGLTPLNGELFRPLHDIEDAYLTNRDLLQAVRSLSYFIPQEEHVRRRINYAALDVEELGSVYESLLEYQPVFTENNGAISFEFLQGTERKSTGSYYTRPELVKELIDSALVPVIEARLGAASTPQHKEQALLQLRVIDPACGSGHFLLAAARRIGRELAKVRTGDDEPPPETIREAIRDVITHCIYGVDKNPLAVDLCKVALWIEGHTQGKPLTFLDHRIRHGDSLVGVLDLKVLREGIPDGAFTAVVGDDRALARELKRRNRTERRGELALTFDSHAQIKSLRDARHVLEALSDDTPEQVRQKHEAFEKLHQEGTDWWRDQTACHLWTAAFFAELTSENAQNLRIPTSEALRRWLETQKIDPRVVAYAWQLAQKYSFFHWPLEFPEVFDAGGFDVVLCNPPWERIKLEEQQFFSALAGKYPEAAEIANAPNKAARERLIKELPKANPALWREYQEALHDHDATSKFLRQSERFPLTARGDINTYAVFSELFTHLVRPDGRVGVVVPTGIATDETNQQFFNHLVDAGHLVSLYDFENREKLFPAVDSRYKFSLLTLSGKPVARSEFAFFLTRAKQIQDAERRFTLTREDLALLNPNTRTCPVFRTRQDAELTKAIYRRVPVLVNERTGENPWGICFLRMLDMANASRLFRTREELEREGYRLVGNRFVDREDVWLPLYEAKMIWHYDHRFGTYEGVSSHTNTHLPTPDEAAHADPTFFVQPWYWVHAEEVEARLGDWPYNWLLGFRDVTNATNERTAVFSLLPRTGIGHTAPVLLAENPTSQQYCLLLANLNSLALDWLLRQKMSGTHLTLFILRQLPVLPPSAYTPEDLRFIVPRVLELVYTSWDIKPFADDVWQEADAALREAVREQWQENAQATGGHPWDLPDWIEAYPEIATDPEEGIPLPPFRWDESRRARLRAELDAYYAKLYGLTQEELRYILDPKDVYGEDFPGETFRVLKEKELREHGEYRTKRLVLEAWERLTS